MRVFFALLLVLALTPVVSAVETQALAVLLDISRSVAPNDFETAKQMIGRIHDETESPDVLLTYVFGSKLTKIDPSQLDAVRATESYTTLYDAAFDAARDLSGVEASRKAVLLFSDGNDTRSVTILEDIVSYTREKGIVVYGVGIGNVKRGSFERMLKLTGGSLFNLNQQDLPAQIRSAVANQKVVPGTEVAKEQPVMKEEPAVQSSPSPPVQPAVVPVRQPDRSPFLWLGGIVGLLFLAAIAFFLIRRDRGVHDCPTCGRQLEPTQLVCPDCAPEKKDPPSEKMEAAKDTEDLAQTMQRKVPEDWLKKSELTQEVMTKTTILSDSPLLLVKKGKNLGQSYPLSGEAPVSIGRSRVNEIQLDDVSVSGQHCRIIPEEGHHILHDLESTNGTFVNNEKVSTVILKQGDIVRIGETFFLYIVEQNRPPS